MLECETVAEGDKLSKLHKRLDKMAKSGSRPPKLGLKLDKLESQWKLNELQLRPEDVPCVIPMIRDLLHKNESKRLDDKDILRYLSHYEGRIQYYSRPCCKQLLRELRNTHGLPAHDSLNQTALPHTPQDRQHTITQATPRSCKDNEIQAPLYTKFERFELEPARTELSHKMSKVPKSQKRSRKR